MVYSFGHNIGGVGGDRNTGAVRKRKGEITNVIFIYNYFKRVKLYAPRGVFYLFPRTHCGTCTYKRSELLLLATDY